jgi:hypothetical protein
MFAGIPAPLLLPIGHALAPVLIVAVSSSDGFTGALKRDDDRVSRQ